MQVLRKNVTVERAALLWDKLSLAVMALVILGVYREENMICAFSSVLSCLKRIIFIKQHIFKMHKIILNE